MELKLRGRPRISLQKAEATGATKHNPARFKGRKPPSLPPLGRPPAHLTDVEKRCWAAFRRECPWLTQADRCQVEIAAQLRAYTLDRNSPSAARAKAIAPLLKALAALGASPVERSRVNMPATAEADPADEFIN